jgi:hypothetical protein
VISVLPVVQQLTSLCKGGLGQWCHRGAPTQDVTDTATVLQIRSALLLVEDDLKGVVAALVRLSKTYRDTPMIGRSNLQQAVPPMDAPIPFAGPVTTALTITIQLAHNLFSTAIKYGPAPYSTPLSRDLSM